jgi:hypothetical protein
MRKSRLTIVVVVIQLYISSLAEQNSSPHDFESIARPHPKGKTKVEKVERLEQ